MIDELKQFPEELIIHGHTYDKFFGTRLDLALRSQDIRYLIITGIMADILEACFDIWKRKIARFLDTDAILAELKAL